MENNGCDCPDGWTGIICDQSESIVKNNPCFISTNCQCMTCVMFFGNQLVLRAPLAETAHLHASVGTEPSVIPLGDFAIAHQGSVETCARMVSGGSDGIYNVCCIFIS